MFQLLCCVKAHRKKSKKNNTEKVWKVQIKCLSLHRYPENNLFTLKED